MVQADVVLPKEPHWRYICGDLMLAPRELPPVNDRGQQTPDPCVHFKTAWLLAEARSLPANERCCGGCRGRWRQSGRGKVTRCDGSKVHKDMEKIEKALCGGAKCGMCVKQTRDAEPSDAHHRQRRATPITDPSEFWVCEKCPEITCDGHVKAGKMRILNLPDWVIGDTLDRLLHGLVYYLGADSYEVDKRLVDKNALFITFSKRVNDVEMLCGLPVGTRSMEFRLSVGRADRHVEVADFKLSVCDKPTGSDQPQADPRSGAALKPDAPVELYIKACPGLPTTAVERGLCQWVKGEHLRCGSGRGIVLSETGMAQLLHRWHRDVMGDPADPWIMRFTPKHCNAREDRGGGGRGNRKAEEEGAAFGLLVSVRCLTEKQRDQLHEDGSMRCAVYPAVLTADGPARMPWVLVIQLRRPSDKKIEGCMSEQQTAQFMKETAQLRDERDLPHIGDHFKWLNDGGAPCPRSARPCPPQEHYCPHPVGLYQDACAVITPVSGGRRGPPQPPAPPQVHWQQQQQQPVVGYGSGPCMGCGLVFNCQCPLPADLQGCSGFYSQAPYAGWPPAVHPTAAIEPGYGPPDWRNPADYQMPVNTQCAEYNPTPPYPDQMPVNTQCADYNPTPPYPDQMPANTQCADYNPTPPYPANASGTAETQAAAPDDSQPRFNRDHYGAPPFNPVLCEGVPQHAGTPAPSQQYNAAGGAPSPLQNQWVNVQNQGGNVQNQGGQMTFAGGAPPQTPEQPSPPRSPGGPPAGSGSGGVGTSSQCLSEVPPSPSQTSGSPRGEEDAAASATAGSAKAQRQPRGRAPSPLPVSEVDRYRALSAPPRPRYSD